MVQAVNFSIIGGWFPVVVVTAAFVTAVLTVGWRHGSWRRQLLIGVPLSFLLTVLTGLAVHVFNLVPDAFPFTFYGWAWLLWFAIVAGVIGWRHAHWTRRTVSVLAVLAAFIAAFTVINQSYDYYPTLDRLFGKEAAHFVALPQLQAIRDQVRKTGHLPTHGDTISIHIPPTVSHFSAVDAYVYLPPIWFANPQPQLPVIELIAGVPGDPSDWTRAGFADTTSTAFAEAHGGKAPILVMPDANGTHTQDSECDNTHFGNAQTYLTVDVPAFVRSEFDASTGKNSLAVAGLSAGGTCAVVLALKAPSVFPIFGDYSGYAMQNYQNQDTAQSIQTLFGGSRAKFYANDPTTLLKHNRYPSTAGWFEVGLQDQPPLDDVKQIHALATAAGIQTCYFARDGGHDFTLWSQAFKDSLPWLSWRLGLTPAPVGQQATCQPPVP
jgi:enterochelin esterase-like enzyme